MYIAEGEQANGHVPAKAVEQYKPASKTKRAPKTAKRQSSHPFRIANEFYRGIEASGLKHSAVSAWLILWLRTDSKTGLVRMSLQTLATKIGIQRRQCKNIVRDLVNRGFLETIEKGGPKGWKCNTYRVHPTPAEKR
jgi:hypothetical protein